MKRFGDKQAADRKRAQKESASAKKTAQARGSNAVRLMGAEARHVSETTCGYVVVMLKVSSGDQDRHGATPPDGHNVSAEIKIG